MTHDAAGPTVSEAEARRIEEDTAQRLLGARKLILIVDLDQTIVHATVDPTVGEWIAQGQAYEHRMAAKSKKADGDQPRDDDEGDEEEVNPNWAMLKDVAKFKLGPELPNGRNHANQPEEEGCDYFIKPR